MSDTIRRREFLGGLGAATILASGASTARAYPANETLRVGCIGTGGRCSRALLPAIKAVPNTRVTAVCDVWDHHLNRAKAAAHADAFATKEFERVLDSKEVDAVIIATPDHWHVPITVAACEAKKDVYVEKPLTHDLSEGARVIAAQNDHARIVQVGMQQRSMPQIQKARELVRAGHLGDIVKAHLSWNRNARLGKGSYGIDPKTVDWKRFLGVGHIENVTEHPFDEYRFRNWRWFWDHGGGILTDLMVHFIDVMNWLCEVEHPDTAWTMGDHFQVEGVWETPETIQTMLHYPVGGARKRPLQVYFEGTFSNARNAAMLEIMGTKATLYVDRGRYELHPERGQGEYEEFVPGKSARGADFDVAVNGGFLHMKNWVDCVRSRMKPAAPVEAGVNACTGAHLGNQAYRSGKVARWKA